jgi:hypothetical protein
VPSDPGTHFQIEKLVQYVVEWVNLFRRGIFDVCRSIRPSVRPSKGVRSTHVSRMRK